MTGYAGFVAGLGVACTDCQSCNCFSPFDSWPSGYSRQKRIRKNGSPNLARGSVFMLVSCFSTLCLAVQSDTDPVFPKTFKGPLINSSVQLGR